MSKEDYTSIRGSLRIKGSAGISKPKSKKKKSKLSKRTLVPDEQQQDEHEQHGEGMKNQLDVEAAEEPGSFPLEENRPFENGKTEAEKKFEEARKKKLDQTLLRDAAKSHKERVEEFNKYLSNLSEHHDM
ncbi:hypothetical protein ABW20_dc0100786 [Dactylellina cionopaga]|nr:hypothetical protein ABW20_dc0100786 [Dactylellina cionopaga]